jgi:alkanesulfonate monooxygenase SsuD/methylene tetrahydromethanopterin reductase-like flavin-dependent oxidoreductase (luciferase family)
MSINIVPVPTVAGHWDAVLEGAKRTGNTPDRSQWRVARDVYVADTNQQARREVLEGTLGRDFEEYFLQLLPHGRLLDLIKEDKEMPDSDVTVEYLLDNIWIVGDPATVAEKLRKLYHDVGGFGVLLVMGHEWKPREEWQNSLTLLMKEVMPKLADLN